MKIFSLKSFILISLFIMISATSFAQDKVYNEKADSTKDIAEAIAKAKTSGKNVFIMIGGNWGAWCNLFDKFSKETPEIAKVLNDSYVKVCVSARENRDLLIKYKTPNMYPFIVILNSDGKVIHKQDSVLLEEEDGYSKQKTLDFMLKCVATSK